jgi:AraC-like DNA-binding protein
LIQEYVRARRTTLAQVHAVEACTSHAFPRHTHDNFGIGLIVRGAQRSWSGRGTVEAGRGSLITCNPGEVHDGTPIGGSRSWRMLYSTPEFVTEIAKDIADGARMNFEFTHPVIGAGCEHVRRFEVAYAAAIADGTRLLVEEALLLLFAGLLAKSSRRLLPSAGIGRAKTLIDDDPGAAVSLAALARETGLSRYQVVRAFAREIGLTPHAYLVQRRLAAARAMIARRVPLSDIASTCGFADQSHFNRHFVRSYGMTPGTFAAAYR